MIDQKLLVFGGSGSPRLTRKVCDHLGVEPGENEVIRFSEGNLFVRICQNVRGRHIYLVQSTAEPVNDNFMELVFWIDAFRRASASSVTVVIPYFSYAKGDKKDEPRVSIRARVCADMLEVAGADRVVTMDLHAPQIQGFFRIPVDDLYAMPVLCEAVRKYNFENLTVVSPDSGFVAMARRYASELGAPVAIGDKERFGNDEKAVVQEVIGDVKNRTALIVDDFTISAGTLISVAKRLLEKGAREVWAAVTHGVFSSQSAIDRIAESPIRGLFVTDSVETSKVEFCDKIKVVSVAPLFAEAIHRIHYRESISGLFPRTGPKP